MSFTPPRRITITVDGREVHIGWAYTRANGTMDLDLDAFPISGVATIEPEKDGECPKT